MAAALLPLPEIQLVDANGKPYAGASVYTYIPGTTTPMTTWSESTGTVANTNPIILNAAGRAIVYGSGQYRFQAFDTLGNLIYDQLTSSLVSSAMAPVLLAPDLTTALSDMGVTAAITVETNRAEAAEASLQTAVNGTSGPVTTETNRAKAAETTLQTNITNETTRAEAAEAALQTTNKVQAGVGTTGLGGHVTVTYPTAFATATLAVTATLSGSALFGPATATVSPTAAGFDCWWSVNGTTALVGYNFNWVAVGH